MGRALLDRWASVIDGEFVAVDPAAPDDAAVPVARDLDALDRSDFDVLVVAVKPQLVDDIAPAAAERLTRSALVVSVAAGVPAARFTGLLNARPVARLMPNMPVAIGEGVSGLFADAACGKREKTAVQTLAEAVGEAVWVEDEDQLDRFTAIAGSGPGYVFEIARNYADAAVSLGFEPETARRMVLQVMAGAARMAAASDKSLGDLRDAVTSKKGTTEAGLNVLREDRDLERRFKALTEAAYKRAVELRG